MKNFRKITALMLSVIMVFGICSFASADAATTGTDIDYTITNPYKDIDFSTIKQYKTALHTHTNASDGDCTLRESLERHAETGYDLVATTDHGTCNKSWAEINKNDFIYGVLKLVGRTEGDLDYLGTSGSFNNGVTYTVTEKGGDQFLNCSNGSVIMRIPYGVENGAVSVNAHVNSWFAEHENNNICDYADTIKSVEKSGAICVINHPGEYTKAKDDLTDEIAYNESNFSYGYYINKFYYLIDKYDSCIGLDINSKGDSRTRYDRKLWDILLKRRTAKGKNVYAIASSDAHQTNKIDTGFAYLLMSEKTSAAAKVSLANGQFFAGSHCNGNYLELKNIAENLKKYYGETELYNSVKKCTDAMEKRVADVASGEEDADASLGNEWECLDNRGYCNAETQPMITSISVDDTEDTITVKTENALLVRFIADGEPIAVLKADEGTATIDLDEYSDKIGTYVRAEVFGEGGTVYTQAFVLSYAGQPQYGDYHYFNIPTLDFLFAEIRSLFNVIKVLLSR